MSKKPLTITWLPQPEEHDYPAAASYLSLIYPPVLTDKIIKELREAPVSEFKAKDVFRASGLSLLGVSNGHVKKDQGKIEAGKALSPLLLLRDNQLGKVVIADGYHRMCAIYSFDEDAIIHGKIV